MPTYVYETIPQDGSAPEVFEVQRRMSDPPLEVHPESGVPVRRVFTAPYVGTKSGAATPTPAFQGCGSGMCSNAGACMGMGGSQN